MRGEDQTQHELFGYGSLEERVPQDHPLRPIRAMVDEALKALDGCFDSLYDEDGRKSIPPERPLRALLLQMLYSIRSERMLMEQMEYNLLYRWFVGMSINEQVWHPTVFTKNRDRQLEGEIAEEFFRVVSDEHFTVDGTLIEAWAGQKSFQLKDDEDVLKPPPPPDPGSNPTDGRTRFGGATPVAQFGRSNPGCCGHFLKPTIIVRNDGSSFSESPTNCPEAGGDSSRPSPVYLSRGGRRVTSTEP